MGKGIFLTVKDLMQLTGSNNYFSAAKAHRTIRDAISSHKKKLTVKEYCKYEKLDFTEIWAYLREKK